MCGSIVCAAENYNDFVVNHFVTYRDLRITIYLYFHVIIEFYGGKANNHPKGN